VGQHPTRATQIHANPGSSQGRNEEGMAKQACVRLPSHDGDKPQNKNTAYL
jgi:hypothetical protein